MTIQPQAFIAAYRRFFGRRDRCSDLYNGGDTTFMSADTELDPMFKKSLHQLDDLKGNLLVNNGVTHMGGLWEAAVTHHLRLVILDSKLTFEEISY